MIMLQQQSVIFALTYADCPLGFAAMNRARLIIASSLLVIVLAASDSAYPETNAAANIAADALPKKNGYTRYYDLTWGTWPNIQSISNDYLSFNGLINDGIGYAIKGSRIDNIFVRLMNYLLIQGGLGCYLLGTLEHELGHVGYAFEAGYKPHLASFDVQLIRREFLVRSTDDKAIMYLAGGMNIDSFTSYEATKTIYSGSPAPCYYGIIITYKKIANFQYVYSKARFMKHPMGNIKEYYKDFDPLIYDVYLSKKYGYYDSALPVWAYAPYFKKSLFIPENPYAYINPFLKDQYRKMKTAYLIELLDPSIVDLFYGWVRYVGSGESMHTALMIPTGPVSVMPGTRASLGNLGAENYYDLHFVIRNFIPFSIYYRRGGNKWDTVHGAGIDARNIPLSDRLYLDCQLDYWTIIEGERVGKNRAYLLYNSTSALTGPGLFRKHRDQRDRFNIFLKLKWEFIEDWYFTGGIGYKRYGALIGRQLEEGVYGHGGIGFNINYAN